MPVPNPAHRGSGHSPAPLEDAELVRRAQLGSVAAFEQLVLRHGPRLHRYLAIQLGGHADAQPYTLTPLVLCDPPRLHTAGIVVFLGSVG